MATPDAATTPDAVATPDAMATLDGPIVDARPPDGSPPDATPPDAAPPDATPDAAGPDLTWAQWPMPDSPTIYCTDGTKVTACPSSSGTAYPQDGNVTTINAPSYSVGPDTVIDLVTGLTWERVVDPGSYVWSGAQTYCTNLKKGGFTTGWRLPTRVELISILDYGSFQPAIDTDTFTAAPADYFWSASPYNGSAGIYWMVDFFGGGVSGDAVSNAYRVRCVR